MCSRPKIPAAPPLPPPRAAAQAPQRSGAAIAAGQRINSTYGARSQVPAFAMPVVTAKLGGVPTVLGA